MDKIKLNINLFISHSVGNLEAIWTLRDWLVEVGLEPHVGWRPRETRIAIDQSDCVLAIMTSDGTRGDAVYEEVRYAKEKEKMIVPLVERGIVDGDLLEGLQYIPFSRDDLIDAAGATGFYFATKKARGAGDQKDKILFSTLMLFLGLLGLSKEEG